MDLTRFYRHGFTTTIIPEEKLSEIMVEIRMQKYGTESSGHPQVLYPSESDAPAVWKFWRDLGRSEYFSYIRDTLGDFTYHYPWIFRYSKDQKVPFHHDIEKGMPVLNILYLTLESFVEADGGYLKVANLKRPLRDKNLYELGDEDISEMRTVLPNNGVLVTINNADPLIVHSVERMRVKKDRYTLSCLFGQDNAKDHLNLNERKYL